MEKKAKKTVPIRVKYIGVGLPEEYDDFEMGETYSLFVYDFYEDKIKESIRYLDPKTDREITPAGLKETVLDRHYKDLYWWYDRYQDYGVDISFPALAPIKIEVTYVRSDFRVRLAFDYSKAEGLIDKEASYLYCQQMTYNSCKCHLNDHEVFYFDLEDDMTFGVVAKKGKEVLLFLNGVRHEPTKTIPFDKGYDLSIFGTLEEDDGFGGVVEGEGEHIYLKDLEVIARIEVK